MRVAGAIRGRAGEELQGMTAARLPPRRCRLGATSGTRPRAYVDPEMAQRLPRPADAFDNVRETDTDIGEPDLNQDTLAQAEVDVTYRATCCPVTSRSAFATTR